MSATTKDVMSSEVEFQQTTHEANNTTLQAYYQVHAQIYDLTRWSFLFGRKAIVDAIAQQGEPARILEVGCGTGKNLHTLHQRFPKAQLTGVDLSADMLTVARRRFASHETRVTLQQAAYGSVELGEPYDLILFSYALTMFNPGWDEAIAQAYTDLAPRGMIAVVDFHDSSLPGFKRWMGVNHVRMDGHLLPNLRAHFIDQVMERKTAYGGIWHYLLYLGRKKTRCR